MDQKRIEELRKRMAQDKIGLFCLTNPIDIFYLTGLQLSKGALFVHKQKMTLLVDSRYTQMCKSIGINVIGEKQLRVLQAFKLGRGERVHLDASYLTHIDYLSYQKLLKKHLKGSVTFIESDIIKRMRLVKSFEEISIMRQAAKIAEAGYYHICSLLKEGISEKEVARQFKIFCLRSGADDFSFEPTIMFGENTAFPHHRSDLTMLKHNDLVLIDVGVKKDGYCSDMTRMQIFGEMKQEYLAIAEVIRDAFLAVADHAKPGVTCTELDKVALEIFEKANVKKHVQHALGHSLGLEIHEYPTIRQNGADVTLEAGMVFAIEPGLYLDKWGMRLENMLLITENGCENLYSEVF